MTASSPSVLEAEEWWSVASFARFTGTVTARTEVNAETVIFLHIERTAGTTLYHVAARHYERAAVHTFYGENTVAQFEALPRAEREAKRLLRGHIAFGVHHYAREPVTYITLLRDPVARFVSHYRYILAHPNRPGYREIRDAGLEGFASSGRWLDNPYVRAISGDVSAGFGGCTELMLERAMENIEECFAVVGISECLDETLVVLSKRLGWRRLWHGRLNATRPEISAKEENASAVRAIREINRFDCALYETAAARLLRIVETDADIRREVARLRLANRMYAPIETAGYRVARSSLARRLGMGDRQ